MTRQPVASIVKEIDDDLRAIRQILRRPVEADVERGGLTAPQQGAMRALIRSGSMSLKELSKELGLAHSTVSGIVDRLEKQGMVERKAEETDLRLSKIVVAEEVRTYLRDTWPALEMHPLAEALRAATPAERQEVLQGVRVLRRLLDRTAPAAR